MFNSTIYGINLGSYNLSVSEGYDNNEIKAHILENRLSQKMIT